MATSQNNQEIDPLKIPDGSHYRVGMVVSEWHPQITKNLENAAKEVFKLSGIKPENLHIIEVPGSYELIAGAQMLLENRMVDAVVCLGCIIRGETSHFEYISGAVSLSLSQLAIQYTKPIIFGVLTTENMEQAQNRSGGKMGNKGADSALTALKMIHLKNSLIKSKNIPVGFL